MQTDNFKSYAKAAKKRLRDGFWLGEIEQRQAREKVAATSGVSRVPVMTGHREDLRNKIYNANYNEEQEFYRRVVEIMQSGEVVINPIGRLADTRLMETMTAAERQAYVLKLSARYVAACEKYRKEKGIS